MTWPMCPAFPNRPSNNRPSKTIPPPTPVDTTIAKKFTDVGATVEVK